MNFQDTMKIKKEAGFSLVELVASVIILGILTGVMLITITNKSEGTNLEVITKKIISDLRYAQDMAMSSGTGVEFVVDVQNNEYSLKWVNGSYLPSIRGNGDFIVTLNQGNYVGVTFTSTELVNGKLTFNIIGTPWSGGNELQSLKRVVLVNNTRDIKVTPYTGKVFVQ